MDISGELGLCHMADNHVYILVYDCNYNLQNNKISITNATQHDILCKLYFAHETQQQPNNNMQLIFPRVIMMHRAT